MRKLVLLSGLLACGEGYQPFPVIEPPSTCTGGLELSAVERRVAAPADIALRVEVRDCAGRAVAGLPPEAFVIREDGAVASIYEAPRAIAELRVVAEPHTLVLLDLSGSVHRAGYLGPMIDGAKALVGALAGHRVAIWGFDGRPTPIELAPFTEDRAALEAALERVRASALVDDSTNLNGAVVHALDALDRAAVSPSAHGALVLFTDGSDRAGRVSRSALSARLTGSKHDRYAIGVGADIDPSSLAELGRAGRYAVEDASQIGLAFDAVARDLEARLGGSYRVAYCTPARAGTHRFELAVHHGEGVARLDFDFDATGFGPGCAPESMLAR